MRTSDLIRLVVLAAIWGSSYIFIRILAPAIGPMLTVETRVALAGVVILVYCAAMGLKIEWRRFGKHYVAIGMVNTAIPFMLYAFAALYLPASYSVILNSSAPMFGALFAAAWLGERLTVRRVIAMLVGIGGVAFVAHAGPVKVTSMVALAIVACLLAGACYGLAGVYTKKYLNAAPPQAIAGTSHLAAAVVCAIPALVARPAVVWTPHIIVSALALALMCSAVAYLMYFRLIAEAGPTKALTVTFLMPAFGMLWGALFLRETITPAMVLGCALILIGTADTVGLVPVKKRVATVMGGQ